MKTKQGENQLVTKGYLSQEFTKFGKEVDLKIDLKFDEKLDGLRDELVIWKDEILTANDKVIKKLDTWLTEREMIHFNYQRLEGRVSTLEQAQPKVF